MQERATSVCGMAALRTEPAGVPDQAPDRPASRRLTADQRREQLLAVALDLFGARGYQATTMDDIALAAGVTKPLVYQHFTSKRALYVELVEGATRQLLDAIAVATVSAQGPREEVELGFSAYFHMVLSGESAFRLLYRREDARVAEIAEAIAQVETAIAEAIDPLIDAGLAPDHRLVLAHAVVGMAEGASRHWLASRERSGSRHLEGTEVTREAQIMARRLADLAWAGLRSVHAD